MIPVHFCNNNRHVIIPNKYGSINIFKAKISVFFKEINKMKIKKKLSIVDNLKWIYYDLVWIQVYKPMIWMNGRETCSLECHEKH